MRDIKAILHHIFVDFLIKVVYNIGMKNKKYYIDVILEKERLRNENMLLSYTKRMSELPKGSLVIRKVNSREYCYLRYREGEKVILKYAGTINQIDDIKSKIEERKHLIKLIDMLKEENKRITKMEAVK